MICFCYALATVKQSFCTLLVTAHTPHEQDTFWHISYIHIFERVPGAKTYCQFDIFHPEFGHIDKCVEEVGI